jgi:hypothetical protein
MKKLLLNIVFVFLMVQTAIAQTPDLYPPKDPEPIDFSIQNIILYIVMPLVLIVAYLLYRRKKRKDARKKEEEKNS